MPDPPTICIKLHRKGSPLRLPDRVDSAAPGFVLRDSRGHEHHFGDRQLGAGALTYTYVASYSPTGGPEREYHLRDELTRGREVVALTLGPKLTPLTRAAINHVINECARKGFAFEYEKTLAVEALLALLEGNEPIPAADIEVYAATHGLSSDQAEKLREFAERVIEGRSFRPAIRLGRGQGEKYREYWLEHPEPSP